jgi:riboflavin synthase
MFTGLVEETGQITAIEARDKAYRLSVQVHHVGDGIALGDSLAVNGCCLTVVDVRPLPSRSKTRPLNGHVLSFDLLQETWDRTNLSSSAPGQSVNLERALSVGDRLGGHFVTGHIDTTGKIVRWEQVGRDWVLEVRCPRPWNRHLIEKGSIAVDGISLTVAALTRTGFEVWIIPHTYEKTVLRERQVGDQVNLETDMLGKYVERLLKTRLR